MFHARQSGGYDHLAFIDALWLSQTGLYVILVEEGYNQGFQYALSLFQCPGPNLTDAADGVPTLSPNTTRAAGIDVGDMDAFTFQAVAGDSVRLALRKTSGSGQNAVMNLFTPDCSLVATATGVTNAEIRMPCLASRTGSYTVLIRSEAGNEPFNYALTLTQHPVVPPSSGTQQYLSILHCTNQIILRWETNSAGFVLERATDPGTANWLVVGGTPSVLDRHFYLNEGLATGANQFYRLRCTNCGSGTAAR